MDIRATIPGTALTATDFSNMRKQLDDLQLQMSTGQRANTYGGLGLARQNSLNVRGQIANVESWQQSISEIGTRLSIMDGSLGRMIDMTLETKKALTLDNFKLTGGQTQGQALIKDKLAQAVELLNGQVNGHYLFGGRQSDAPPVVPVSAMMNGADGKDGFQTVMAQRRAADLGGDLSVTDPANAAFPRGRMTAAAVSGTTVTMAEDGAPTMPFGVKFDVGARPPTTLPMTITGTMTGVTAQVALTGGNVGLSIAVTSNPSVGQSLPINLQLPDGSKTGFNLVAVSASPGVAQPGQFVVDPNPAVTATNMKNALASAMDGIVRADLTAASAAQAGADFFKGDANGVPQRVAGGATLTSFYTSTAMAAPATAAATTVAWYVGDKISPDARATAGARVDSGVTISFGARADETGMRSLIQNLAVATTMGFDAYAPSAGRLFDAFTSRINDGMSQNKTVSTLTSVRIELAVANTTASGADSRHKATKAMLQGLLSDAEGVKNEELAAQILTMQNRMQASFQTTATLSKLSLVDYIK